MNTKQLTKELYTAPLCVASEIEAEGVLCSSIMQKENSIMDYEEEIYQW